MNQCMNLHTYKLPEEYISFQTGRIVCGTSFLGPVTTKLPKWLTSVDHPGQKELSTEITVCPKEELSWRFKGLYTY